jgi:quinol-cytochrome oxidoreductase complex cytochrome b subunit
MLEPKYYAMFFGGIAIVMAVVMTFIGFRFLHSNTILIAGTVLAILGVAVIIFAAIAGRKQSKKDE